MAYLVVGVRALLLGVFAVALLGKVRTATAFKEFTASVVELRLLPRNLSRLAAMAAVAVECAIVVSLAMTSTVDAGFGLAIALLVVFTGGILLALRRGRRASCRCFGASATRLGPVHVTRNVTLIAIAVGGLLTTAVTAGSPHPAGIAVALGAALVGVVLVVRLDDLAALFTPTK
jgi:hypothetical protein